MIYSQSCEYAIRALTYLVSLEANRMATVTEISEHENLPKHFLSKLLLKLSRAGIVLSAKGPGGGYALAHNPSQITLLDVVDCIDGPLHFGPGGLGLDAAAGKTSSKLQEDWLALNEQIRQYLLRCNLLNIHDALQLKLQQLAQSAPNEQAVG